MYTKRVFCVAAIGALFASGVDARALLQEDPVDVSPSELVCTSCKQAVAQGEAFVNDPDTLEKLDKKIKKLCADKGDEAEMVRPPHETRPRTRAARPARAPTPGRAKIRPSRQISREFLTIPVRPAPPRTQCERLMEDAVDYAVDYMNTRITPDAACAEANLCPGAAADDAGDALSAVLKEASSSAAPSPAADCLKCKFGVEALHQAFTSNETVTAMEQKAEEACAKYAASLGLESTCEAAVETYGPVVVNRATAFLADADKVCAELHMCPPVDEAREGSNRRNPVKLARRRAGVAALGNPRDSAAAR